MRILVDLAPEARATQRRRDTDKACLYMRADPVDLADMPDAGRTVGNDLGHITTTNDAKLIILDC